MLAFGLLVFLPAGSFQYPGAWLLIVLLFLPMLPLGSPWGFLLTQAGHPPLFLRRIFDEEKTLSTGLPGHGEYMQKVKYRLIPYSW